MRDGARGGCGRHQQEVRGMPVEATELRPAVVGEEALVWPLREGARGGCVHKLEGRQDHHPHWWGLVRDASYYAYNVTSL